MGAHWPVRVRSLPPATANLPLGEFGWNSASRGIARCFLGRIFGKPVDGRQQGVSLNWSGQHEGSAGVMVEHPQGRRRGDADLPGVILLRSDQRVGAITGEAAPYGRRKIGIRRIVGQALTVASGVRVDPRDRIQNASLPPASPAHFVRERTTSLPVGSGGVPAARGRLRCRAAHRASRRESRPFGLPSFARSAHLTPSARIRDPGRRAFARVRAARRCGRSSRFP